MSWKTKTLPVVFGLIVLSGSTASRGEDSRDPSHFTYARLYCAPDGNTRFQDVTAELRKTDFAPQAPPIHIGSDFAASRAFFGGFEAGWGARDLENRLNHPTPATQFRIVLQAVFCITNTDGETRRLPPGSVFRLEDTSPCKGDIFGPERTKNDRFMGTSDQDGPGKSRYIRSILGLGRWPVPFATRSSITRPRALGLSADASRTIKS